ncbi:MAG TPA: xanthine dehydrogenase [Planctomycetes bacterium]|nr:xanthine dehydrogenase [Planctomycetota bacterium]
MMVGLSDKGGSPADSFRVQGDTPHKAVIQGCVAHAGMLSPRMPKDLYEEIVRLRRERIPAALATVVSTRGSTPGKLAQKMLVRGDGTILGTIGGGCVEADVIRGALDAIETGLVQTLSFTLAGEEAERTGLACGGAIDVMIEPLNDPHLFVIGLGHVGQRIAKLAATCGFKLTVFDDRPDFANAVPEAAEVVCEDLSRLAEVLSPGPNSYVISVTRGHDHDYEVLSWALRTDARFIGVIGSRSKRVQFFRQLTADGFDEADLERVHLPVGIDIGAKTPDEIAVSVVSQLVAQHRLGRPEPRTET